MGGRIPDLTQEEMTERQRTLYAAMAASFRGPVQGPFPLWVRNPEVGEQALAMVKALRDKTAPARPLRELAILLAARQFGGQYPWAIHAPLAKAAGLDEGVIEAIRTRRRPNFPAKDQETFYVALTELYDKGRIGEASYAMAEKTLGREVLLDLMSVAAFYSGLALFLTAFEVPAPAEAQNLPA
jgi:4-carboxymuconolactone decarboxylase